MPAWLVGRHTAGGSGAVKELIDSFLQEPGENIGERLREGVWGLRALRSEIPV